MSQETVALSNETAVNKALAPLLGAPKTTLDIQKELNNPYSLTKQAVAAVMIEIWTKEQFRAFIQKMRQLIANARAWLARQPSSSAQAVDGSENEEKVQQLQEIREVQETVKTLENRLDTAINMYNSLLQDRDDLVAPMVAQWRKEQQNQVDTLTATLANLVTPVVLTPKEQSILSDVAKGQMIQLTRPHLIPPGTTSQQVNEKAYSNFAINFLRVIEAKRSQQDGYTLVLGKPSAEIMENKTLYVYLDGDSLKYSAGRGVIKIENGELNDAYLRVIKNALRNSTENLQVGDEATRELFKVTGYTQKFEPEEIQSVKASEVKTWAPVLKPHFEQARKKDEELDKKQATDYQKLKKINEDIQRIEEEIKNLEQNAQNSLAQFAQTPEASKSTAPTPFSTRPTPLQDASR